jgi:osmotically-inducible protein OsmY
MAIVVAALLVAGCTSQSREEYGQAGNEAAQAIKTDASAASKMAAADAETAKVKSALITASGLNVGGIHVETNGKEVFLKGSVPSAEQKHQAEKTAKGAAGRSYTVIDQLAIGSAR